jgi:hypothetical protein
MEQRINLDFKAGFVGASQDKETGTMRPIVGWLISLEGAKPRTHNDFYDNECDDEFKQSFEEPQSSVDSEHKWQAPVREVENESKSD